MDQQRHAAFESSATTPRLSLDLPHEKMESDKASRGSSSSEFVNRQVDRSLEDSSEENIATEKDIEKDLEKQAGQTPINAPQPQNDLNLVGWDGPDDPENPMNFSKTRKWIITLSMASMTICITFSSSVFSTATVVTAKQFGVSNEVTLLGTSLFVLVSPLFALPALLNLASALLKI
jgi:DHA1 family multidrug resistance protein-like MFS transporter